MNRKALVDAIAACGSQAELARRIGATTAQVNEWTKGDRPIPPPRCEQIERATDGAVRCEDLRADLDWHRTPDGRVFYREPRPDQLKAA